MITPERKAELEAELDELFGLVPTLPKPKVITRDDRGTIRDADVHVSRADPNAAEDADRVVQVRRDDWVTIDDAAALRQFWDREAARRRARELDPFRMGLYGPVDEDDE